MTNFIAMDFETTGLDPDRHGPISVGFSNNSNDIYATMHPGSQGRFAIDAKALEVNRFTMEEITPHRSATIVDLELYEMLKPGYEEYGKFEAVGLNVGNFDMQFLRKFLPNTYSLFGHRPVDLNSVFLAQWGLADWKACRDIFTERAMNKLQVTEDELHHALIDAQVAWEIFVDCVDLEVEDLTDNS